MHTIEQQWNVHQILFKLDLFVSKYSFSKAPMKNLSINTMTQNSPHT